MFGSRKVVARLDEMLTEAINGSFVESNYDETELSRLESKFRQYLTGKETAARNVYEERAAVQELVTDISHQTKTPIANLSLYAQLLEEVSTPEMMPYVEQIRMQTEKLEFLIASLTKISRLESDMIQLHPKPQPVSLLIEESVQEALGRAAAKQIVICVENEADAAASYDMRWTKEALGNLLDNAVKYSPHGSTITVSVRVFEMFVCIGVQDEGPGVPEDEQAQIFERFYRGKHALHEEGSGVGLYLARMIVRKQHGYMKVSSLPPHGSCFRIYLLKYLQKR